MKITKEQIPAYGDYDAGERIELTGGMYALVKAEHDNDMGPPWKEHDGHGAIREALEADKRPGERVMCKAGSRDYYWLYDIAETVKIARRDGWDAEPYGGTKGERAARAVEADFKRMRGWLMNDWYWMGVSVKLYDKSGTLVERDSLWGIESEGDHWREVAADLIENMRSDYATAQREARKARRAADYTALQTRAFVS